MAGRNGKLSVGVIGTGWIGRRHAEALSRRSDTEVRALCDLDLRLAEDLAKVTGGEVFSDWRELLETAPIDAVFVATPPRAHVEPAIEALRRRIPLYLEKPIARDIDSASAIASAAAESRTVCAVGYQWHSLDILADARTVLDGRPVGCAIGQGVGGTAERGWFLDRSQGGGNLLERGSHHIDLVRAIAGEVVSVQAAATSVRLASRSHGGDIEDAVTLLLHLEGGGIATIVVAWTNDATPSSYGLELLAEDATLRLDLDPIFRLTGVSRGVPVSGGSGADPFDTSFDRFLEAVREGAPELVACPPDDAVRTLEVAVTAEVALVTGRTERVRDSAPPF